MCQAIFNKITTNYIKLVSNYAVGIPGFIPYYYLKLISKESDYVLKRELTRTVMEKIRRDLVVKYKKEIKKNLYQIKSKEIAEKIAQRLREESVNKK